MDYLTQKIKFSFDWKFKDITLLENVSKRDFVNSKKFCCSYNQICFILQLQMSPNGTLANNKNELILRILYVEGILPRIQARFDVKFISIDSVVYSVSFNYCIRKNCAFTMPSFGSNVSSKTFQNQFRHGEMKIRIAIEIPKTVFDYKPAFPLLKPNDFCGQLLPAVLSDAIPSICSDVTLISKNGQEFRCHKLVLSTCAPFFFKKTFESGMLESSQNIVNLPTLDDNVLSELLYFIYKNDIRPPFRNLAKELLHTAEMFQLSEMKKICEYYLFEDLCANNAVKMLVLADLFSLEDLKSKSVCMIADNFATIVQTVDWNELRIHDDNICSQIILHATQRLEVNVEEI